MANQPIPIRFQIFKGNQLVREETLNEPVIKIGKLASSHLRLDEETVSRMHAVVEVTGPGEIQLIDLGSTRGTMVNGERINKAVLKSGDEVCFGDARVLVTFGTETAAAPADTGTTPVPAAVPAQPQAPEQAYPAPPQPAAPAATVAYAPPPAAAPPPQQVPPPAQQFASPPAQQHAPAAPQFAPPAPAPVAPPAMPLAAAPVFPGHVAAEVEVFDGSKAIEVQAIYRGVVINTRHLTDPSGKTSVGKSKSLILAGVAACVVAIAVFLSAMVTGGQEKARYEKFIAGGGEFKDFQWSRGNPALDFIVFGGIALGISLVYMGLKRRTKLSPNYIIGSDTQADTPVASEIIGTSAFSLVSTTGADFLVNVTPSMTGEVQADGGQTLPLQQFVQQRGASFSLGDRGRAKIDCGATTFLVSATPKPRSLPVPFLIWRWSEQAYTVGTAAALLLFLLMIFSVPPDPKSLSLDLFNADSRFVNFLIKPPEEKEEEIPEWLKKKGPDEQGGKGKRHKGEEGKMGKKTSKNKEGLYGLKGPKDNPDPHLAKKLAEEQAKNAGILGVLRMNEGSHLASIFGRDTALGNDAVNVLGGLIGNEIGEAYGVGGLGLVGTGTGGGGTGEGTIGLGNFGTIGKGGGGGSGSGYGRGAGGLGGRRARAPDVIPGQANVRGSLDKEIIRRIIRRHINEVKYCYEKELVKRPTLAGRIAVQFTIAASGQVIASVLQSSTMGNLRVENCVVQAVRRWEFPKPMGGGIVIVSYPFVFNAGSAGE
ncbi:MAG: TonB family protein [Deltaproteobacteria bacterium]|nr:TonB family protein [Deltaproteobacteria bacterium]